MSKLSKARPNNLAFHFLPVAAVGALVAGLLVYLLARPTRPELVHLLLAPLGRNAQSSVLIPLPLAYQLPSFFHMLALMLGAAAITRHQPKLRAVALTVTFVIGLCMEFIQHPTVTSTLNTCSVMPCSWVRELGAYAHAGTFDVLDLYAIALAALIAMMIVALNTSVRNRGRHTRT